MVFSILRKQFVLTDSVRYFLNCHASTLVRLENGDLLTAFFAGTKEGHPDVSIWTARRCSGKWEEPVKTFSKDGTPLWNPVLHRDGSRVWLFYKIGRTVSSWITLYASSDDGGRTWSEHGELSPGDRRPRGPVKNKLLVLSDGWWAAPGSVEGEKHWEAFVDLSPDKGKSWTISPIPIKHTAPLCEGEQVWEGLSNDALWETNQKKVFRWDGVIQPTLWESSPGHVHAFMRSTRGSIYRSDSYDFGRTWNEAYATELPNNNSGLDLVKTPGGVIVLAHNPVSGNWSPRTPLSVSLSWDNGKSFTEPLHLETQPGEYSYPAVIYDEDALYITYTWNRTNIVLVEGRLLP